MTNPRSAKCFSKLEGCWEGGGRHIHPASETWQLYPPKKPAKLLWVSTIATPLAWYKCQNSPRLMARAGKADNCKKTAQTLLRRHHNMQKPTAAEDNLLVKERRDDNRSSYNHLKMCKFPKIWFSRNCPKKTTFLVSFPPSRLAP